ncbi:MAG: hypothetical protein J6D31_02040 [Clostridia bacterium]|nr:hypothetical protein [Clostridia bacterium]
MPRRRGEAAIPAVRSTRVRPYHGFTGLDCRRGVREGGLRQAQNIDPRALPALQTTAGVKRLKSGLPGKMLSLHVLGETVLVFYQNAGAVYLLRRLPSGQESTVRMTDKDLDARRTVIPFNRYSDPADPLSGSWAHLALVYPDGLCFDPAAEAISFSPISTGAAPTITHACVHLSRVFGAHGDRLYASGFNDPADWDLDTAADVDGSNAWASTVQSNTRAGGDFTALCVYQGHVLAFKRGFCHVLNNNKNPFRVADLLTVGTIDSRTVAEVNGKLLFVAEDGVYRYNGDTATRISEPLGELLYTGAVATAADGLYYLYTPADGQLYVYAEETGAWCARTPFSLGHLVGMAAAGTRCYMLSDDGSLYATGYGTRGSFTAETWPALHEELGRVCRLSLVATTEVGSRLQVKYIDQDERGTMLLAITGNDSCKRYESRAFTPASYGGRLVFTGVGRMVVQDVQLLVAED